MPVAMEEFEIGLRELGKAMQDFLFSYFSHNMPDAYKFWMQSDAILANFDDGDYHIIVTFRKIYSQADKSIEPDIVDQHLFHFETDDDDCMATYHAEVVTGLVFAEDDTLIQKGAIHIKINPIMIASPDDAMFAASELLDDMLAQVWNGKNEQGH